MSFSSSAPVTARRSVAWMGRGLLLGVAAAGLVVGGAVGQVVVAYFVG